MVDAIGLPPSMDVTDIQQSSGKKAETRNSEISSILKSLDSNPDDEAEKKRLLEACRDFEAIFVNQLIKSMRKTIQKEGLIDGGKGEEIFQSMLDEEYAREMTKAEELGLAKQLYSQLVKKYR